MLDLALTAVTFVVSFAFTFGPGAYRMSLPPTLLISVAAAGAVWLSGRRPRLALALTLVLTVSVPLLDSAFQAMDIVIVFVAYRVTRNTQLPVAGLAVFAFVGLTVTDSWQRIVFDRTFATPSVLYPVLLTALAVGLGAESRRVAAQRDLAPDAQGCRPSQSGLGRAATASPATSMTSQLTTSRPS